MAEKYSKDDIKFKEMSEGEAVATFVKDGYDEYTKRSVRYGSNLSPDSEWAKAPAKMFVAFNNDKPVGVVGFSEYKNVLLGAGIHIRKDERGKGLFSILVDKVLSEKGSLKEATANLYAAMHRLDAQNLDLIIAQKFPEIDLGKSINDRLERATKN